MLLDVTSLALGTLFVDKYTQWLNNMQLSELLTPLLSQYTYCFKSEVLLKIHFESLIDWIFIQKIV